MAEQAAPIRDKPESPSLQLYGSVISTFTRKVMIVLEHKGIDYALRMPGHEKLLTVNPLGKVPVLLVDEVPIIDSSIICDYLERSTPNNPVYPVEPLQRTRAIWIEEYADTVVQDAFFSLMNEMVFKPKVYGEPGDAETIANATVSAGKTLDYLEGKLTGPFFVGEQLTIADITVVSVLGNPLAAGFALEPSRWPRLAESVSRQLSAAPFAAVWTRYLPAFAALQRGEHLRR